MRENILYILLAVIIASILSIPSFSLSETDLCKETGIIVKNMDLKQLWYKKNGGDCFLWKRNYMFTIYPEDTIGVYSDLTCKTLYCGVEHTFFDYKAIDTNNDCRVRILPGCNLSDM